MNEGHPTRHTVSKRVLTTKFWELPLSALLVQSKDRVWWNYVELCVRKR